MDKELVEALNPKQCKFLTLFLAGHKVYDAYKLAGYEGDSHAAYILKGRLNKELEVLAASKGCSKADLMASIATLNDLPVVDKNGQPVSGINMTHKLKLLALQQKTLDSNKAEMPKITAIQINNYPGDAEKTTVVETTALPGEGS